MNRRITFLILLIVAGVASAQVELFETDQSGLYFERENYAQNLFRQVGYVHKGRVDFGIKYDYYQDFGSTSHHIGPKVEYRILDHDKHIPLSLSIGIDYQLGLMYVYDICYTHSAMIQSKVFRKFNLSKSFDLTPSARIRWRYYFVDHEYRLGPSSSLEMALNCKINFKGIYIYPQLRYLDGYTYFDFGFGFKIPFKRKA